MEFPFNITLRGGVRTQACGEWGVAICFGGRQLLRQGYAGQAAAGAKDCAPHARFRGKPLQRGGRAVGDRSL